MANKRTFIFIGGGFLVLFLIIFVISYFYLKEVCLEKAERVVKGIQEVTEFSYDDMDCNPFTSSVSFTNVKMKSPDDNTVLKAKLLTVAKVNIEDKPKLTGEVGEISFSDVVLTSTDKNQTVKAKSFAIKDVKIKDMLIYKGGIELKDATSIENGKKEYIGDAGLFFRFKEKDEEALFNFYIKQKNLLNFKISLTLSKFSKTVYESIRDLMLEKNSGKEADINKIAILAIVIKKLTIEFEDKGGFFKKRVIEQMAKEENKTPQEVERELLNNIDEALKKSNDKNIRTLLTSVKQMVKEGKGYLKIEFISKKDKANILSIALAVSIAPNPEILKEFFDIKVEGSKGGIF